MSREPDLDEQAATASSPIEWYDRVPIQVREYDPEAPRLARRVIGLIAGVRSGAVAEHVGSSAVPGLAGKGIIDLLLPTAPEDIPEVADALVAAGFQRQTIPDAFPPTRPMLQGAIHHCGTLYRLHVHVVPAGSGEVAAMRGFRDALRADPALRDRYVALKRDIVARGLTEPGAFTHAKRDFITAALADLGLPTEY
ncbi:MAG TPA: GrpB family protein [Actinomycetes bacterium]